MNKTALVTGVSRNIGNAIARELVNEGYFVYGTYNASEIEARHLKQEIGDVELFQVDLSNREQTLGLIQKLQSIKLDALINNAGIIIFEPFEKLSYDNWDKVLEVNLNAPLLLAHGLRDSLKKNAVIVNIASVDGVTGSYASISYSASKAALINLTKSLGNIFAKHGVRVTAIAPGLIGSGMDSPAIDVAIETNPMGRTGTAEEIAKAVAFLISDKASFINGTTLIVDGGYTNFDPVLKKESESFS